MNLTGNDSPMARLFGGWLPSRPCLVLAIVGASVALANATTVNFNGIRDGTLLSGATLFGGKLLLQGQETETWSSGSRSVEAGVFRNGELHLDSTFDPAVLSGDEFADLFGVHYETRIIGTFLDPVTAFSFQSQGFPCHWFSYSGVDQAGNPFASVGMADPDFGTGWATLDITPPEGGYLTGFQIWNGDLWASAATVALDNIRFTARELVSAASPVPDIGSSLALLGLASAALAGGRFRRGS